jgi:hypothetical protein
MRNAERFDRVFDGWIAVEGVFEGSMPATRWEEVIQFGVEAKRSTIHVVKSTPIVPDFRRACSILLSDWNRVCCF